MEDPKFEDMTPAAIESIMQDNDQKVIDLRAQNLRAHKVLEQKESIARTQLVKSRSPNFPAAQVLGDVGGFEGLASLSTDDLERALAAAAAELKARREKGE